MRWPLKGLFMSLCKENPDDELQGDYPHHEHFHFDRGISPFGYWRCLLLEAHLARSSSSVSLQAKLLKSHFRQCKKAQQDYSCLPLLNFSKQSSFGVSLLLKPHPHPSLDTIRVLFECRRNVGSYLDEKVKRWLFWGARYNGNAVYIA